MVSCMKRFDFFPSLFSRFWLFVQALSQNVEIFADYYFFSPNSDFLKNFPPSSDFIPITFYLEKKIFFPEKEEKLFFSSVKLSKVEKVIFFLK